MIKRNIPSNPARIKPGNKFMHPHIRLKIIGLFRLFRFELPFIAGICVIVGEFLANGAPPQVIDLLSGFAAIFLLSSSALILNDYFDIETDKINAPERPLPSGMVTKLDVVLLFFCVSLLGLWISYQISDIAFAVSVLVWCIGILYNWRFKLIGFAGNLMVSFSVGMTFIFGGIVVQTPWEFIVWFFAVWVLLINLGEETAADALDREGDRRAGSRSLAVLYGSENAMIISSGIFMLVIILSGVPFLFGWLDLMYAVPLFITDAAILFSVIKLNDHRRQNRRVFIRVIYLSGLITLLFFLGIRLTLSP